MLIDSNGGGGDGGSVRRRRCALSWAGSKQVGQAWRRRVGKARRIMAQAKITTSVDGEGRYGWEMGPAMMDVRSLFCIIGDETRALELSPPEREIGVSLDLRFRASLRCEGCLC